MAAPQIIVSGRLVVDVERILGDLQAEPAPPRTEVHVDEERDRLINAVAAASIADRLRKAADSIIDACDRAVES